VIKTKKLFVLVFLLLNCILFSACSQSKEVDFVKKYKIDLNTVSDVTEVLQKAIDELNGVEYDQKVISVSVARPRTERPSNGGGRGGYNNSRRY
jgi:uncharacterized membrane protein